MIDARVTRAARIAVEVAGTVIACGVFSYAYVIGAKLKARDYWRERVR